MLRGAGITRREWMVVAAIAAVGLGIRLAFVIATHGHALAGDEIEYDSEGRFIDHGHWFWTTAPTGEPHAGAWKTPVYPVFVGLLYRVLGSDPDRVLLVQTLIGPITIVLTWLLARRLFGARVGIAAAAVVAVSPFAWQFEIRLLAESIVTPMTLLFLIVLLDRPPTTRRAAVLGGLLGLIILTRPSSVYLVPALVAAFVIVAGVRRGAVLTALSLAVAALIVAPWSIRNYVVMDAFVPISVQDITPYGTFNDDAANDPAYPWAWRVHNSRDDPILLNARRLGDLEVRKRLKRNASEYIKDHPTALAKAFFWNGLTRFWDLRRPGHVVGESPAQGRSRTLTAIGLPIYWALLALSVGALWMNRGRRAVVVPIVVLALSASVVFTAEAATRYRAPFEPLIAVLGCAAAVPAVDRLRERRHGARELAHSV